MTHIQFSKPYPQFNRWLASYRSLNGGYTLTADSTGDKSLAVYLTLDDCDYSHNPVSIFFSSDRRSESHAFEGNFSAYVIIWILI
jgi:hypothetical protein